jgi:chromosome segregation ATPase
LESNNTNNLELSQSQSETTKQQETSPVTQSMDWQKVAHKLREYNRKLLKKVFKLEQELAEVEHKFHKQIEKSQSSDRTLAQQAEEIKNYQQDNARLEEELAVFQQETHSQQVVIESLSKQLEVSQQQAAKLERECALLQENYNQKTYELISIGKEAQELHSRLNRQQHYTLQYKAALDQYVNDLSTKSEESSITQENLPTIKNQPIQAWSGTSETTDKKLSLPKTNIPISPASNNMTVKPESDRTTAKTTEWLSPAIAKTQKHKKNQSLAAVELPQLPR